MLKGADDINGEVIEAASLLTFDKRVSGFDISSYIGISSEPISIIKVTWQLSVEDKGHLFFLLAYMKLTHSAKSSSLEMAVHGSTNVRSTMRLAVSSRLIIMQQHTIIASASTSRCTQGHQTLSFPLGLEGVACETSKEVGGLIFKWEYFHETTVQFFYRSKQRSIASIQAIVVRSFS